MLQPPALGTTLWSTSECAAVAMGCAREVTLVCLQVSQFVDTFVYFSTCVFYAIGVALFLFTLGVISLRMRRTYKQSGHLLSDTSGLVLRSSAQLLHHLSVQFSVFVALVMICFLFRAGYELCTTMHQTFHRLNTSFPAGIPPSLRSGDTVSAATTVLFWVMFRFCFLTISLWCFGCSAPRLRWRSLHLDPLLLSYNYQQLPDCQICGRCQPPLLVFREWVLRSPVMEVVLYLCTEASDRPFSAFEHYHLICTWMGFLSMRGVVSHRKAGHCVRHDDLDPVPKKANQGKIFRDTTHC